MAEVDRLAKFVKGARYESLSAPSIEALKIRILDSIAVAIGAMHSPLISLIRDFVGKAGGPRGSSLIGSGTASPPFAAFYNSALIRYLDFNDSILTPGETFHPSDVIGGLLAFGELADATGKDLLLSMALSYQVQASLSEAAPVRARGFDHTVQLAYGAAAAFAKILGLEEEGIANALAISGTTNCALRVTRTGRLSNWKGLAAPYTVFSAANCVLLAAEGITGPREVFEGNKGFKDTIAGPFEIDWERVELSAVSRSILKKFDSEIHSQSTLEAVFDLKREFHLSPGDIEKVDIDIFDVAFQIIGGGEEGDKRLVRTKEEADHSLPYLVAVALIDGDVMPAQFEIERIVRPDVQSLMERIHISPSKELSERFPAEMPVRVHVTLKDGKHFEIKKVDYEGFHTRPITMEFARRKLEALTSHTVSAARRSAIVDLIGQLEDVSVKALMRELCFETEDHNGTSF